MRKILWTFLLLGQARATTGYLVYKILLCSLHSSLKLYLSNYKNESLALKIAQPGGASHFDLNFYIKAVLVELISR